MSRSVFASVALILTFLTGPLAAQGVVPPGESGEASEVRLPSELDRVLRDYESAWHAGDAATLASLFAEDGFVLQSNRPPIRGRSAIQAAYEGQGGSPLRLRALAFATGDSVGYIIGAYGYGDAPSDTGKFTLTLKRDPGGRWVIVSDMDNSNGPPSSTTVTAADAEFSTAFALEQGVARIAASFPDGGLWPGFDPLAIPLAVYDGTRTVLFRHPSPPPGFTPVPVPGEESAAAIDGRHEEVVANTTAEIGGVLMATVMLDGSGVPIANPAAVAVHEAFHVYQAERYPDWQANEADLFVYPTDDPAALALRRLETSALRRALGAPDASAACWSRAALGLRAERHARLDSASVRYERMTELNEGLAAYVEARAAGRTTVDLPEAGFGPTDVRLRGYATGTALAFLLDRTDPGWRAAFDVGDQTLDDALARALGAGETCAFGRSATVSVERKAREDVSALQAQRTSRLAAFEARAGWYVVVEVPEHVLWVEGFDPLNVERVDMSRVLHRRMLRLANERGTLRAIDSDTVDVEALTEGVGRHPLFTGVARATVSVVDEPTITESDGTVDVTAPGFAAAFEGARVAWSGRRVTIRLDP